MSRNAVSACVVVGSIVLFAAAGVAAPLSVNIIDHDFTFDVPYFVDPQTGLTSSAVYDYNGAAPDILRLTQRNLPGEGPAGDHNAASYAYAGIMPQVTPGPIPSSPPAIGTTPPLASPWLYPLYYTAQFGANLEIELMFNSADGPYVNPAGDTFDISLVGQLPKNEPIGFLRITGWIGNQSVFPANPPTFPDPPAAGGGVPQDIVLLEIAFTKATLLARAQNDTADLVEATGRVNTLLGWDINELVASNPVEWESLRELVGVTFFKFMLPSTGGVIYPTADYDPLVDYPNLRPVFGRISGEAGVIPEPASMFLLGLGGLALLRRRRKA